MKSDNNLCVEVACFVKNEKLPTHEDFTNKPKHEGDEPEYLNELMWAHYADSHRRSKEFIEELPIEFYLLCQFAPYYLLRS